MLVGGPGDDMIRGQRGTDVVSFEAAPAGVSVSLRARTASGQGADILTGVDRVIGSSFDDLLIGDRRRNSIRGRPGNDVIRGLGGDDNLSGQDGNNRVLGGIADDTLYGSPGNDRLSGGDGVDRCDGGPGVDRGSGCEATSDIP